jgi:gliding motility-associated-like protein
MNLNLQPSPIDFPFSSTCDANVTFTQNSNCAFSAITASIATINNPTFAWSNGDNGNTTTAYNTDTLFVYVSNPITCCVIVDTIIPIIAASSPCSNDLELPNVFTPNNDGENDYFQVLSFGGLKSFHCTILNRWGQVIREYDHPSFKWDGKNEALHDMVEGVYFYIVNAETNGGNEIKKHGTITLIR